MKILIVAYYYPPLNSIASQRPYAWAKYWSRAGHDVRVLTAPKSPANGSLDLEIEPEVAAHVRVEGVPFWPTGRGGGAAGGAVSTGGSRARAWVKRVMRDLRRSVTGTLLDTRFFWVRPAVRHAIRLYREWPFDVVVSTYNPPATHLIGAALAQNLGVRWVADYRDLWAGNPVERAIGPFSWIQQYLENRSIKQSTMISTSSPMFQEQLEKRFRKAVLLSENGFDTELELERDPLFSDTGKILLVHTGTVNPGLSNFIPLFEAVKQLEVKIPDIKRKLEIQFIGRDNVGVADLAHNLKIDKIITEPGFLPYKRTLQTQRHADGLLVFDVPNDNITGWQYAKIFEYLYAGKPILCIGAEGKAAGRLVEESGCGTDYGQDVERIAAALEDLIAGRGLPYAPRADVLARYTREATAMKMLTEIEKMVEARRA